MIRIGLILGITEINGNMSGKTNKMTPEEAEVKMMGKVYNKLNNIGFRNYDIGLDAKKDSDPYYQLCMIISGKENTIGDFICYSEHIKQMKSTVKNRYPDDDISYILHVYFTDKSICIYADLRYNSMYINEDVGINEIHFTIKKNLLTGRLKRLYDLIMNNRIPN